MNINWFKHESIFVFPVSAFGWIITLLAVAYAVYSFIEIDSVSHSVSDTLRPFAFRFLLILIVYIIIGFIFSGSKKN